MPKLQQRLEAIFSKYSDITFPEVELENFKATYEKILGGLPEPELQRELQLITQ